MYRILMFQNRDALMSQDRDTNHAAKLLHDDSPTNSPTSTGEKIAAGVIVAGIVLVALWAGDAFGHVNVGNAISSVARQSG